MVTMLSIVESKLSSKNSNDTIDSLYSLFETALLFGWVDIAAYILKSIDSMSHKVGFLVIATKHGFHNMEEFEKLKLDMGKFTSFNDFSNKHDVKDAGFYLVKFGIGPWRTFTKFFATMCFSISNIAKAADGSYSDFEEWIGLRVNANAVSAKTIDKIDLAIGSSLLEDKKHRANVLTMYMHYLDSNEKGVHTSIAPEEKMIYVIHTILTILEYDVKVSDFPAAQESFDDFINASNWTTLRRDYSDQQRMHGFEENWKYMSKQHSLPSKESYIRFHGTDSWNKFESLASKAFADDNEAFSVAINY